MTKPRVFSFLKVAAPLVSFALALCLVPGALPARGESALQQMAPARVIRRLAAGTPQDLIVVFNAQSVHQAAAELERSAGIGPGHHRVLELKASGYAGLKRQALSRFASEEAGVVTDFSHLPVGYLRVHSKAALDKLMAQPEVAGVYENTELHAALANSLPLIGEPQVAAQGYQGSGSTVAVLDTGTDYTLPAFGSCSAPGVPAGCKVSAAADFIASDGKLDSNHHGTNVAGIVLGVAPGSRIASLRVLNAAGSTTDTNVISAINWCIQNKAAYNIVAMNLSLGGSTKYGSTTTNTPYYAAFTQALAAGIIPVVAAGNSGWSDGLALPAAAIGAVSVGAVYDSAVGSQSWITSSQPPTVSCTDHATAADQVTCFSNSASFLTLLAPGSPITAAGITESGTSQATPHVAGAVAVLRAAFPGETLAQTVARLQNGVAVTDPKNDVTKPRLSLPLAMAQASTCSYALGSPGSSVGPDPAGGTVSVTTGANCPWIASSNSDWIGITSGASGTGNGAVGFSVAANPGTSSRTGTLSVAGKSYSVTQTGSVAAQANVLANGDFESGPLSWSQSAGDGHPIIAKDLNPGTNNWFATLCGYNNCSDTLYQDVSIPADAQSATLRFSYAISTQESSTLSAYDTLTLKIYSPPTSTDYKYWTLSNLDATAGWTSSTGYDLSAYKGKLIRVQFSAGTDYSFPTSFLVDQASLTVSGSAPDTTPPTVPAGLTAVALSTGTAALSWGAASDNVAVVSYQVYRGGSPVATLGNLTSWRDTGLAASTTYSYQVRACDAAGNCSALSAGATLRTPGINDDSQPPGVPAGLSALATGVSSIDLSWGAASDNVGVTSYKLFRNGTLLRVLGPLTSYGDTELTPSTLYSYTVAACDAAGNCSPQSPAVTATTLAPFKQASLLTMSGSSTFQSLGNWVDITLDRMDNNSAGGHSGSLRLELWALTAPYFGGSVTGYITASIRTRDIAGAGDYLYGGRAFIDLSLHLPYTAPPAGNDKYALLLEEYDPTNCSTPDHFCIVDWMNYQESEPPSVPTGLSAAALNSSQVALSWSPATDNVGVTTYQLYRNATLVTLLGNVTSYQDGGLAPSTRYSYAVAACDAVGNCSPQSPTASATTTAAADTQAPAVPTGLSARAAGSSRVDLAWSPSADNVATVSYRVFSDGNLVATLGNVTATSRAATPSTSYRYSVAACDAAGNCSAQSQPATVTTPAPADTQPPSIPTGVAATALGATQIRLSWNPSTDDVGVAGYRLSSNDGQLVSVGSVTTYTLTGLRSGTSYSYAVAACDAAGNCSAPSTPAAATTPAAGPAGPALSFAAATLPDGAATRNPAFPLEGRVQTSAVTLTLSHNGGSPTPVAWDGTGAFRAGLLLTPGVNTLVTAAGDAGGNLSVDTRSVTFNPALADFQVTTLSGGSFTKSSTLAVAGTVGNPLTTSVTLALNGGSPVPVPLSGSAFSTTVGLSPGANALTLTAHDSVTGTQVQGFDVTWDGTLPLLSVLSPAGALATPKSSVVVAGKVEAGAGAAVAIAVDGTPLGSQPAVAADGSFSASVPLAAVKGYDIAVTATVPGGTNATVHREVLRRRPSGKVSDGVSAPSISDALQALRHAVGLIQLTPDQVVNVDVAPLSGGIPNPDGVIDIADALAILRKVVGLVDW